MTLAAYTNQPLILPNVHGGDAASVINELTQALHGQGVVSDSLAFYHAALNREYLAPTHVTSVIAFPHARSAVVSRLGFAAGRSAAPIPWGQKLATVQLVFLIAIPASDSGAYLGLMSGFARLLRSSGLRDEMLRASTADHILELLGRVNLRTASVERATAEIDS